MYKKSDQKSTSGKKKTPLQGGASKSKKEGSGAVRYRLQRSKWQEMIMSIKRNILHSVGCNLKEYFYILGPVSSVTSSKLSERAQRQMKHFKLGPLHITQTLISACGWGSPGTPTLIPHRHWEEPIWSVALSNKSGDQQEKLQFWRALWEQCRDNWGTAYLLTCMHQSNSILCCKTNPVKTNERLLRTGCYCKNVAVFPYLLRECYLRISNRSSLHLRVRVWLWEDSSETTVCS